ncbi:MAG: hypothetical protein ACREOB_02440 [Thermodesulfobacteriota bacterium]
MDEKNNSYSRVNISSSVRRGNYTGRESKDGFKPDVCLNIPVGIEKFQYMDPSLKHKKISCADVARCAAQTGQGAPADVPCE